MFALTLPGADDGLTLREVITDIPHDFAALVVYLTLGLVLFLVWWGSRAEVIRRHRAHPEPAAEPEVSIAGAEPVGPVPARPERPAATSAPAPRGRARRDADTPRIRWIG